MFVFLRLLSYNDSVPQDQIIQTAEERKRIMSTDLAALTEDPELGAREFTVRRSRVVRTEQGTSLIPEDTVIKGIIQPAAQPPAAVSPNETSAEKTITVYTAFQLSTGTNNGSTVIAADELLVPDDGIYRVTAVKDWGYYGIFRAEARRLASIIRQQGGDTHPD